MTKEIKKITIKEFGENMMEATVCCVLCNKIYDNLDGNDLTRHCFCGGSLMPVILNESTNLIPSWMVSEEASFIEYPTVSC